MVNPDGVAEAVHDAEEICAVASMWQTHDDLVATGLQPEDFHLQACAGIWREALNMSDPCPTLLAERNPDLLVDYTRFYGRWWMHVERPCLMAHIKAVRQDSERRRRLRELGKEAQRVHRGEVSGGVSLEYSE